MKKITMTLILLLSIMTITIGINKAEAFNLGNVDTLSLRELDATVHTGKIVNIQGLQDSVSDWQRLNLDVNLKADVFKLSNIATLGVTLQPSLNYSEDINLVNFTGGVYLNPFNNRHVEVYYKYTDSYDIKNKLNQNFSFSNNEVGIRFILVRR